MRDNESQMRMSLNLPDDLGDAVLKIRQKDEFRRCSIAEILRILIEAGLNSMGYTTVTDKSEGE